MMHHSNDNHPIRFLSVCSGIEAASVAWSPLGWKAVAFGEIDKGASAVLAYRYPHVPNLGDFTSIKVSTLGRVDILCGGTPCQAFSVAGARRGLDDARGNLSLAFVGLAHELADNNGLRNAVWENVPGVLTMADNAFGCFLGGLVGADGPFVPVEPKPADRKSTRWWRWSAKDKCHAVRWPKHGMVSGPKGRAAWAVKDAQYFGLAQRRERVLVVADFGAGADPAAVLFERVSVPWNPPARGEKRESVAVSPTIRAGGNSTGGHRPPGTDVDTADSLIVAYAPEIARCDATREGSSQDYESTTMVAHAIQAGATRTNPNSGPDGVGVQEGIAYTLEARAEVQAVAYSIMPQNSGKDYKARIVEVAQPLMASGPVGGNQGGDFIVEPVCVTGTVTHTLKAEGADASEDGTGRGTPIIAFDTTQITSATNRSNPQAGDPCHPLSAHAHAPAIAFNARQHPTHGAVADPLGAKDTGHGALIGSAVRRLTPRECERLQGFPDDYTRIPVRHYANKKVTKNRPEDMWEGSPDGGWWLMQADGPRYKQLGNSWAVPKFRWLGERIQRLMPSRAADDYNATKLAA